MEVQEIKQLQRQVKQLQDQVQQLNKQRKLQAANFEYFRTLLLAGLEPRHNEDGRHQRESRNSMCESKQTGVTKLINDATGRLT